METEVCGTGSGLAGRFSQLSFECDGSVDFPTSPVAPCTHFCCKRQGVAAESADTLLNPSRASQYLYLQAGERLGTQDSECELLYMCFLILMFCTTCFTPC